VQLNHLHVKYLLVGAGLASSAAAVAIRKLDPANTLLMIGQEINRPYHRAPLSKDYLRRQRRHEDLFTLPDSWFTEHRLDLRTGRRVAHLDTARGAVTLDNGMEISYDQLLLATGDSPNRLTVPGAELPNLFYVRTLDDVERLGHAIDIAKTAGAAHSKGRGRVVIIGGGLLGVELTGSLTSMGLAVDLIVGPEYPWYRFAGEGAGKFVSRHLQVHGVQVHNGRRASRLEGDGRVQHVILDDGQSLTCDFAIAAVGSHANRELLRGTPIAAEKAILVDVHCRTTDPHVYAAGDCAAVFDPLFEKHRIIDHWDNAIATGTIAGTNMAGGDARYQAVSTFGTAVFDLVATVWGEPRAVEHRIIRAATGTEQADFIEIGIAPDGRVAQVLAIGQGHDVQSLEQLVAQRLPIDGNAEQLKDPAVPLSRFV
jgi:3-phenylpropionate/trans-cinnamate dioxygenase ferredoxin reductase component